ncbi:MAG: KilA-N domain-containing protein [Bacteroidota bacterium]
MSKNKLEVEGLVIRVQQLEDQHWLSMTDIAKKVDVRSEIVIQNWLRNAGTLDFLREWEDLFNPDFNHLNFDVIRSQAGKVGFVMTPKRWTEMTNAIGIRSEAGRYGGTYAHKDIAIEFGSAVSARFKLFLIREFDRLKEEEAKKLKEGWDVKRLLAKVNYQIHTEAVRSFLVQPKDIRAKEQGIVYASEADLLNVAVFGMTARQWREQHPDATGNLRDQAKVEELVVLANLESLNAKLLEWDCDQEMRVDILNETARKELEILKSNKALKALKK